MGDLTKKLYKAVKNNVSYFIELDVLIPWDYFARQA